MAASGMPVLVSESNANCIGYRREVAKKVLPTSDALCTLERLNTFSRMLGQIAFVSPHFATTLIDSFVDLGRSLRSDALRVFDDFWFVLFWFLLAPSYIVRERPSQTEVGIGLVRHPWIDVSVAFLVVSVVRIAMDDTLWRVWTSKRIRIASICSGSVGRPRGPVGVFSSCSRRPVA